MDEYDEVAPYKKKSKAHGLKRADHKHTYDVVLLTTTLQCGWSEEDIKITRPTKVCTVCGRIGDVVRDPSYYDTTTHEKCEFLFDKKLSEKSLRLPKWVVCGYNKFATKGE